MSKKAKVETTNDHLMDKIGSLTDQPFSWQSDQLKTVINRAKSGRQPQAWLVNGPEGVGKRIFVHWWLKWLHCPTSSQLVLSDQPLSMDGFKGCGQCADCAQIEAKSHADLLWVQPESGSKSVKIDQIRQVISFSQHTAKRSLFRTVVIEPAQNMPLAAQNALLKTLEEPGVRTQFFLICDRTQGLLPTILSRTQKLSFSLPSYNQVATWVFGLPSQWLPEDFSKNQLASQLQAVQGAPLKLIKHLHDPWSKARLELIKQLRSSSVITDLMAQWNQWSLLERLKVLAQLMQSDLKSTGQLILKGHRSNCVPIEEAFGLYDQLLKLFSQTLESVSLNEVLVWESALMIWFKFTGLLSAETEPTSVT